MFLNFWPKMTIWILGSNKNSNLQNFETVTPAKYNYIPLQMTNPLRNGPLLSLVTELLQMTQLYCRKSKVDFQSILVKFGPTTLFLSKKMNIRLIHTTKFYFTGRMNIEGVSFWHIKNFGFQCTRGVQEAKNGHPQTHFCQNDSKLPRMLHSQKL